MKMIDIYADAGTFRNIKKLATDAAAFVKSVEQVPDIPTFRRTPRPSFTRCRRPQSNVDGDSHYVRVQLLTDAGALDRDKQIALVENRIVA